MTSLPCSNLEDANPLQQYIDRYKDHPNQLIDSGKTFVSTFSGETCHFGQETVDKGWMYAVKAGRLVSFFPAFFVDPATLSNYNVIDGAFNVSFNHLRNATLIYGIIKVECCLADGQQRCQLRL
jgi:glucan endo-1,3-alpha-glucosidase